MPSESERVEELEAHVERLTEQVSELMHQLDRYRRGCEDALQQLDWCIGYFTGSNKVKLAKALAQNRAYIRKNLLKRDGADVPVDVG